MAEVTEENRPDLIPRPGEAVGGVYAITGTLPTLADVVAFTNGAVELDHGYYRFVSHPRLRLLEDELKGAVQCRHCRLAESLEVALLELLRLRSTARGRIVACGEAGAAIDASLLPTLSRDGATVLHVRTRPSFRRTSDGMTCFCCSTLTRT